MKNLERKEKRCAENITSKCEWLEVKEATTNTNEQEDRTNRNLKGFEVCLREYQPQKRQREK